MTQKCRRVSSFSDDVTSYRLYAKWFQRYVRSINPILQHRIVRTRKESTHKTSFLSLRVVRSIAPGRYLQYHRVKIYKTHMAADLVNHSGSQMTHHTTCCKRSGHVTHPRAHLPSLSHAGGRCTPGLMLCAHAANGCGIRTLIKGKCLQKRTPVY